MVHMCAARQGGCGSDDRTFALPAPLDIQVGNCAAAAAATAAAAAGEATAPTATAVGVSAATLSAA